MSIRSREGRTAFSYPIYYRTIVTADILRVTGGLSSVYNITTVGSNIGNISRHDFKAGVLNTTSEYESFFAFIVRICFYYKGRTIIVVLAEFLTKVLASGTTLVQ